MNKFVGIFLLTLLVGAFARSLDGQNIQSDPKPSSSSGSVPFNEEIVVESTLNIRKKDRSLPSSRQTRNVAELIEQRREKRQFGNFGQSSALANANAYNQHFGPGGFGSNAANSGAQSFQSQGPLGGFGASAANSASQGFNVGPGGFNANAGQSGSQSYNLPGGHNVAVSYGAGFNVGPDGRPHVSNTHGIAYT